MDAEVAPLVAFNSGEVPLDHPKPMNTGGQHEVKMGRTSQLQLRHFRMFRWMSEQGVRNVERFLCVSKVFEAWHKISVLDQVANNSVGRS